MEPSRKHHLSQKEITYRKRKRPFRLLPKDDMFNPPTDRIDFNPPPTVPPRPARSQQEAMATVQPSAEDVENLMMICQADRYTAERYLRVKRNDMAAAVNAIFDNEDISKEEEGMAWREDHFTADRDGNERENNHLRPLTATAPGSRMPSPSDGRSTLHPTSKDQEDADMAAALGNSLSQFQGSTFQQESGIIGKDGTDKHFGPATKDHYDKTQWAIVTTAQATSEVIPDADVEQRRNVDGQPKFLKQLPDGDYLPNLLTICHGIAGTREAMLTRRNVQASYGQDAEWWRGHAISLPRIVDTISGEPMDVDREDRNALVAEVQRLMAFLDQGERSYASVVPLTQTAAVKEKHHATGTSQTWMASFLEAWTAAATEQDGGDMFRTAWGLDESRSLFDIKTPATEGEKSDLREIIDSVFWGADADETMKLGFDQLANVLVLHLNSPNKNVSELGVRVHKELHMERYLQENREATADVRAAVADSLAKVKKISEIEKKLTTWKHPRKDAQLNPTALLKQSRGVFDSKSELQSPSNHLPNGVPASPATQSSDEDIAEKLKKVIASIDSKLTILASEKEKTAKTLAETSRSPLPELEGQLKHRYLLRGVATKPNVTYILLPKDDDDEDEDKPMLEFDMNTSAAKDDDTDTPEGTQWWRIQYEVNAAGTGANLSKHKMPGYEVLRAVELEYGSALLVYASDAVNDVALIDPSLPMPLQEFVDTDNELFRAELMQAAERSRPPPVYEGYGSANDDDVRPSIERTSMDSMTAERAGSDAGDGVPPPSPPGYEREGFMDHAAFGLGPRFKDDEAPYVGVEREEEDVPVTDIHLDEPEEERMEMSEKGGREVLISGLEGVDGRSGDTVMEGAESQDMGAAGSEHLEDMSLLR
ncbi:hypothetical protein B0A55_02099 [Friedmanniomyces simplex]|uniref:UBA domain-containing protein n=1 Tax=Friedmanniomyces simplex TaxID=329884 RepID=A0A4V5NHQ3_9PEZI|nr:hypothetical protein B0A55_02099 [Friedmanniomyces simplex]